MSAPAYYGGPGVASTVKALPARSRAPKAKKRISLPMRVIRSDLKRLARDRRQAKVNGWEHWARQDNSDHIRGLIRMAFLCERISQTKRDRLEARLSRICDAEISRLDPRLTYVPRPA